MSDRDLFFTALDVPLTERLPFLQQKAEDEAQRQRVEELFEAHIAAGGFMAEQSRSPSKKTDLREPDSENRDQPGQLIAQRYKLIEQIGEGGMGTVWKAEQLEPMRRLVAVKLIKPGMDSKQVIARFDAERQALAMMDHPHIARIHDGGAMADGRPYFVMELVAGIPLTRYCDEQKLTISSRLHLFTQICQAVQHAHQKGILHRDLKPGNLLVTEHDGQSIVKVIDFGLAKAIQPSMMLTDQTLNTSAGTVVGTPLYMAPEQVERNALDIDTRADIYALGVILYELLTGTTPLERERFRTAAWDEVKRLIREEEPPKPSTRLSTTEGLPSIASQRDMEPAKLGRLLRGDLDWIVMKTLEKDRDRRYASANALAEDVNRFLHDEPVSAGPPSARYKMQKFVRRHRSAVLAACVMALVLIAGIIGTTWGMLTAQQQRDRAIEAELEVRRQKDLVKQEADRSKEMLNFLQVDLLGQADLRKKEKNEGDLKVRTLLDRASERIEGKFSNSPSVEINLRWTLGNAYSSLALYPEAEKHFVRALELSEKNRASDNSKIAVVQSSLAHLRELQGHFSEAERLNASANETLTRLKGSDHPDTLLSMLDQAKLHNAQHQPQDAEKLVREVLQHSTKLDAKGVAMAKHELATALMFQNKNLEAEVLYREALDIRQKELGNDNHVVLANQNNLANCLMVLGKLTEAEAIYRKSLAASVARFGKDHPEPLMAQGNFALILQRQGKLDEAAAILRDVLKSKTAKQGADHPATLSTRHNLASLLKDQKNYTEAEPLLVENVGYSIKTLGPTNENTMRNKFLLAEVYRSQKKHAEAEPLYQDCLTASSKGQFKSTNLEDIEVGLGLVYFRLGKYDEAEKIFLTTCERLMKKSESEPAKYYLLRLSPMLAWIYETKKQPEQAAKWKAEAARWKTAVTPAK